MGILEKPSQARVCCPPFVLPLASMGILGKPSQARVRCPPFVLQLASLGVPGKPSQVVSLLAILCLKVLFGLCFPFRRNHSHSLRHRVLVRFNFLSSIFHPKSTSSPSKPSSFRNDIQK
ncbi:Uncharacterized protein Rs2_35740 [Raphanus sativus]|nr:Uncharacterized protein Rs2_35740 [Raphanus sativus]